jgi:ABC-type nickel/cobalt efflux system permease component RcnA
MKMKILLPILTGLLCMIWLEPVLAQNPFFTPPSQERREVPRETGDPGQNQDPPVRSGPSAALRFQPPFFDQILAVQRVLRQKMTNYARQIQEKPLGTATWQLMIFALVYGMFHALGPGHGKAIVCSYFLSKRGRMHQALVFGNMISTIHILSAVIIVLGLFWLVGSANIAAFHGVGGRLELISYALITCIGLFLLARTLYEWWKTPKEGEGTCSRAKIKDIFSLALASGLLPCPGAALILLFTLSLGVFWAGLLAMIPLALGMGLTASFLGMFTIGSTGLVLHVSRKSRRAFVLVHRTLSCLGALFIIFLGASLYFGVRAA